MLKYGKRLIMILLLLSISPVIRTVFPREKSRVQLFFGVYTQHYGLTQALSDYDVKISNAKSNGVVDFPKDSDIAVTKLIILSDVSGAEFNQEQTEKIKGYVENGGRLLVLGGPFTLGIGQLDKHGLDKILPVYLEPFDLKWEKEGEVFGRGVKSEITEGIDLSAKPKVYWIHSIPEKLPVENAEILLNAGKYPLLISGSYGKGRVFVFTGTPMGNPKEGDVPFWEWDGWMKIIRKIAEGK